MTDLLDAINEALGAMLHTSLDVVSWLLHGPFGFLVVGMILGACLAGAFVALFFMASLVERLAERR
jgi:hypothetical protein